MARIYALDPATQTLPEAAKADLRTEFATKTEVQDAGYVSITPDPAVPGSYLIGE